MTNRNSQFNTYNDGRKIKSFRYIDDRGNPIRVVADDNTKITLSGSHHGEYDLFFIVVNDNEFYHLNGSTVEHFEFEAK